MPLIPVLLLLLVALVAPSPAADPAPSPPPTEAQPAEAVKRPTFARRERIPPPAVETGYDAVVYELSDARPVQIRESKDAAWANRATTTQLRVGNQVLTLEESTARMVLRGKGDELRLPPKSHVEIEQLSPDSNEVSLFLHSGSVWTQVSARNQPDAFRVRTPELTAGVRGTIFRVDAVAGASKVSVFEGVVHVTSTKTGVFVTLRKNEAAVVNADGQIMELLATPLDEQKILDAWEDWANTVTGGTGGVAAGFSPIGSLSAQIAQDNARWEATMQEHMRNVAALRYAEKIEEYGAAFMRFAGDTGVIPDSGAGAWSLLKFDTGLDGWNGPYVDGPIPPLDPWRNPLIYKRATTRTGRVIGRVYSMGEDRRDDGGENATRDILAIIRYFDLPRFADDPAINPPMP
jgi:hypothetical protein